jgi:hypothetical protein
VWTGGSPLLLDNAGRNMVEISFRGKSGPRGDEALK